MRPSYARRRLIASTLLLPMVSTGCAPEFNWREVRYPEHGVLVMFPGKPDSMTRAIDLDGERVDMTMLGTAAGGIQFAVGVVRQADAARREKYLAAMRAQMVRNIAGTETSALARPIPIVDAAGERVGTAPGTIVRADGTMRNAPARMMAGFVGHADRVLQFVALGPAARFDEEEVKVFVDSLRLQRP